MSQFFGCILSGKGKVNIADIAGKMQLSMSFFEAAENLIYQTDSVFICNKLLHNSIESMNVLPGMFETERYILAASCRIDNRAELHQKLNFTGAIFGKQARSDHEYLLKTYEKYQEECIGHLVGDFSFVIWDKEQQKLFMAKDHLGVRPLFYTIQNENLFFSTDLNAFLDNPAIETSDSRSYFASMLHGSYLQTSAGLQHTCYENIVRLRPAHCAFWIKNTLRENKYWVLKPQPTLKFENEQDYYVAFYEKFKEAVTCRLRTANNVGLELSGGLDSSSIACMAGEIIKTEGRDNSFLHTYSLVQSREGMAYHPDFYDEEPYQEMVLKKIDVKPNGVTKLSESPFRTFWEDLEYGKKIHGGFTKMNFTWQKPIYMAMQKNKCSIKLSGFGGDEMVTDSGDNWLYEGIGKCDLALLLRFDPKVYKSILKYFYFSLFGYGSLSKVAREKERDSDFLNPDQRKLLLKKEHQQSTKSYSDFLISNVSKPFVTLRLETENLHALAHGSECRYPMLDIRLLEFWLSIPYRLFEPKTISREFFRKALAGILPDEILNRKDKSSAVVPYFRYKNVQYAKQIKTDPDPAISYNTMIDQKKKQEKITNCETLQRETDMASLCMTIFLERYLLATPGC